MLSIQKTSTLPCPSRFRPYFKRQPWMSRLAYFDPTYILSLIFPSSVAKEVTSFRRRQGGGGASEDRGQQLDAHWEVRRRPGHVLQGHQPRWRQPGVLLQPRGRAQQDEQPPPGYRGLPEGDRHGPQLQQGLRQDGSGSQVCTYDFEANERQLIEWICSSSSLEKHREAVENFKKALELEPDNESYKSNLQIAEDKVKSGVAPSGGMGGMFPGMGGGNFIDQSKITFVKALVGWTCPASSTTLPWWTWPLPCFRTPTCKPCKFWGISIHPGPLLQSSNLECINCAR